jgi:glucose/arabinose dehydrogenase
MTTFVLRSVAAKAHGLRISLPAVFAIAIGVAHAVIGEAAAQNPRIVPTPHPIVGELPRGPVEQYLPSPPGIVVDTFVSGLEAVWSLQFAPDGRLFLTEKPGRIRIVNREGRLESAPWATVATVPPGGEGGLMGLALHPDFPREPWVYVMYTTQAGGRVINRVS